jgi:uncharacterized protein YlxW (UPF0749 family)
VSPEKIFFGEIIMKKKPAIIAALITTFIIGLFMFAIGINALMNTAAASANSSTTVASSSVASSSSDASTTDQQIQQLQALVAQYQARETQYQAELTQAAQELSQANQLANTSSSQAQNYQQILTQLQQAGLIQISADGQITINNLNRRGGFSGG